MVNLDYHDDDGLTALHHAVLSGFEDTVHTLIDAGADVNAVSEKYGTPLCLAALKARNNVVALLLEARASVHGPGGWLGSALHCASSVGDVSTVELLMEKGAKPNELRKVHLLPPLPHGSLLPSTASKILYEYLPTPPQGFMFGPLHVAICSRNLDVAKSLLRFDADVNIRPSESQPGFDPDSDHGLTPVMATACCGYHDEMCLLLENGANVSLVTISKAMSALMFAVDRCQPDSLTRMIRHGAAVNDQDLSGMTALFNASISGRKECLDILLDNGADLGIKDDQGFSALHRAVNLGQAGIVEALLDAGADFNDLTNDGDSPLDLAIRGQGSEIAHALARRGARFATQANQYSLIRLLHIDNLEYQTFGVFDSHVPMPKFITLSHSLQHQQLWFCDLPEVPAAERVQAANFPQKMQKDHKFLIDLCSQVKSQKIEWIWSRDVCSDEENGSEFEAAMRSAMSWHDRAELNFVYLDNLSPSSKHHNVLPAAELERCRWFADSWSLQDLLAGKSDNTWFFDSDWNNVGTRSTLEASLSNVMRIRPEHLRNYKNACVAAKLSWGSRLDAARKEDRSYAMASILGVVLKYQYGEGESEACRRLQEAIAKKANDESLFAWTHDVHRIRRSAVFGLLAPYMDCFVDCGDLEVAELATPKRFKISEGSIADQRGIQIDVPRRSFYRSNQKIGLHLWCKQHCDSYIKVPAIALSKHPLPSWRREYLSWRHLGSSDRPQQREIRRDLESAHDWCSTFVPNQTAEDDESS